LGIKYHSDNFTADLQKYKSLAKKGGFDVSREDSTAKNDKWYFVGDKTNWTNSLFEIVLTKSQPTLHDWLPHFQIDIDTELDGEKLKELTARIFWKNFFGWKLDAPEVNGTVMFMGLLGCVNATRICLGVGTNLRNTKYHREVLLKKI
jgi:hypothetical protein